MRDKYTYFNESALTEQDAGLVYDRLFGDRKKEIEPVSFEMSQYVKNSITAMFEHAENNVYPYLNESNTNELIDALIETKKKNGRVLLNAAGRVGEAGMFFLQKLRALGYNVDDLKEITPEFLVYENDLLLTFSGSGSTFSVVDNISRVVSMHENGSLSRKIYSITANFSAPIWRKGEEYHTVVEIKGRTKELREETDIDQISKWLPLSSTFEYSVALYLEGIIEALCMSGENRNPNSFGIVKETMIIALEAAKEGLYEQITNIESQTSELLKQLVAVKKRSALTILGREKEKSIYFFGLGQNNYIVRLFARRIQNIGFETYVPGPRDIVSRARARDIAIFISNSGNRPQVINKIMTAKQEKCYVILLTAEPNSESAKLADLVMPIYSQTTSTHTADIMEMDNSSINQRKLKRVFELTCMFYFEGISVAIMKCLNMTESGLRHVIKEWEINARGSIIAVLVSAAVGFISLNTLGSFFTELAFSLVEFNI